MDGPSAQRRDNAPQWQPAIEGRSTRFSGSGVAPLRREASVTAFCRRLGITLRALRNYESLGLLQCPRGPDNRRELDEPARTRLVAIVDLRATGLDLATIGRLFDRGEDLDRSVCNHLSRRLEILELERAQLQLLLQRRQARLKG